jgi:hypothetical protein
MPIVPASVNPVKEVGFSGVRMKLALVNASIVSPQSARASTEFSTSSVPETPSINL